MLKLKIILVLFVLCYAGALGSAIFAFKILADEYEELHVKFVSLDGMTERAFEREDMMATEWVQCRVQVETWEKRWQRYRLNAAIADWMCACMGPPGAVDDMECVALTAERDKRVREWQAEWDEITDARDKKMREEGVWE